MEERMIFSSKSLEYISDQIQYKTLDTRNIKTEYIDNARRFIINYNEFHHPAKMLTILIRPLSHTDISKRHGFSNYFYGEKQWDNYGIYPRYNLNQVYLEKKNYIMHIVTKMNTIRDPCFGIENILKH